MNKWIKFSLPFVVLLISLQAVAQEKGVAKPQTVLSEIVQGMPKSDKQEVRVLTASFTPEQPITTLRTRNTWYQLSLFIKTDSINANTRTIGYLTNL